jgi:hypothetical protein
MLKDDIKQFLDRKLGKGRNKELTNTTIMIAAEDEHNKFADEILYF